MTNIIKKWTESSLILRILLGLIIGVVLGLAVPQYKMIGVFGEAFVSALKAIAPLLVFALVSSALSRAVEGIGDRFKTVIVLYILSTFLSAMIAVTVSMLFPINITLSQASSVSAPSGFGEIINNLIMSVFTNPLYSLSQGDYLGILFWAIILGIALKKIGTENTKVFLSDFADALTMVVKGIIQFAPLGVMSIVFSVVSKNGIGVFVQYAELIALLVGSILLVALIANPVIVSLILRRNPYPLVFTCLRGSGITAFFTRSSAANIPVNMILCEKLGLDEDFYSISIPLGATINTAGAAITITIMTLAVCHTLGISVDLPTTIILCLVSTFAACGASGVAGGSLLLIPMACSLVGIPSDVSMQAVALGFVIGVIQDSFETALNSSSDALFSATAEYHDRQKKGKDINFLGEFAKKNNDSKIMN